MNLLHFTDLHWRGDTPRSRKDNYQQAGSRKLAEVRELAVKHNCAAVLFTGDTTHTPNLDKGPEGDLNREIQAFPRQIYGIIGNTHDVWGDNPAMLRRTTLYVVAKGMMQLVHPGAPVVIEEDGVRVQLTGQHYHEHIDRRDWRMDYCVYPEGDPSAPEGHEHWRLADVDYAIHMVHGMLRTEPIMEGVPVTIVDDVLAETHADITISGHDHKGYGIQYRDKRFACNPGALMRLTAGRDDIDRTVQVALYTLTKTECSGVLIPLKSAAPADEVLDRTRIEVEKIQKGAQEAFIAGLKTGGDMQSLDLRAIVEDMAANRHMPERVRVEALRRVAEAQSELAAKELLEATA